MTGQSTTFDNNSAPPDADRFGVLRGRLTELSYKQRR
jgi:hypothetical protein